jgi:hypothetical protein
LVVIEIADGFAELLSLAFVAGARLGDTGELVFNYCSSKCIVGPQAPGLPAVVGIFTIIGIGRFGTLCVRLCAL